MSTIRKRLFHDSDILSPEKKYYVFKIISPRKDLNHRNHSFEFSTMLGSYKTESEANEMAKFHRVRTTEFN